MLTQLLSLMLTQLRSLILRRLCLVWVVILTTVLPIIIPMILTLILTIQSHNIDPFSQCSSIRTSMNDLTIAHRIAHRPRVSPLQTVSAASAVRCISRQLHQQPACCKGALLGPLQAWDLARGYCVRSMMSASNCNSVASGCSTSDSLCRQAPPFFFFPLILFPFQRPEGVCCG